MYALPLLKAEADRGDMARHDHFLKVMERNVVRLTQLMEQLEGLSRLQASRGDAPDVQRTDVASVVREVARQLREMADARGVEIQLGDRMPSLVVDMARLELILMNLTSNAISTATLPSRIASSGSSQSPLNAKIKSASSSVTTALASLRQICRRSSVASSEYMPLETLSWASAVPALAWRSRPSALRLSAGQFEWNPASETARASW